eukprot:4363206-Prymnesium_polylepis.1
MNPNRILRGKRICSARGVRGSVHRGGQGWRAAECSTRERRVWAVLPCGNMLTGDMPPKGLCLLCAVHTSDLNKCEDTPRPQITHKSTLLVLGTNQGRARQQHSSPASLIIGGADGLGNGPGQSDSHSSASKYGVCLFAVVRLYRR